MPLAEELGSTLQGFLPGASWKSARPAAASPRPSLLGSSRPAGKAFASSQGGEPQPHPPRLAITAQSGGTLALGEVVEKMSLTAGLEHTRSGVYVSFAVSGPKSKLLAPASWKAGAASFAS